MRSASCRRVRYADLQPRSSPCLMSPIIQKSLSDAEFVTTLNK